MPTQQHTAILVDPPFSYERSVGQGVAANHYATMTDAQLAALPVGSLAARDAMLFFWCSGPTISRALWLCSQWGFKYKTMAFVWVKTNRKDAPQSMGLGSYTLPGTEFVLLATKGHAAPLIIKRLDQVVMHRRGGHSEKPAIFRELIDEMTGHDQQLRKIELFSRTPADGSWSAWGDQITKP
jgi:N6-adenosine-specific RNA methylase IME4